MASPDSITKAAHLAKQTYVEVTNIEPISPNASPATKSRFQAMLTTVTQACAQALQWTGGMSVLADCENDLGLDTWNDFLEDSDGDDNDLDDDEGQDDDDEGQGNEEELVEKMVDFILDGTRGLDDDREQYSLRDFALMVSRGGYRGKVPDQEGECMRRMVFGYQSVSIAQMKKVFKGHNLEPSSITVTAQSALDIEAIPDLHTRLLRRESLVFSGPQGDMVALYVLGVLRNIAGIKAFEEWTKQNSKYQKKFFRELARSIFPAKFKAIENNDHIPARMKTKMYTKLVTPIRKKVNKLMARREQFLSAFTQFGPLVLLDVTFCRTTSKGYPRESKYFHRTWTALLEAVDGQDLVTDRYGEDRKFVLRALQVLGGEEVKEYARNFLEKHLYWEWDFESDSEESGSSGDSDSD